MDEVKTIYKVQVPLASSEKSPPALVYDEQRKKQIFMPVTDELLEFMDGEPKKFVFGAVNRKTDNFEIHKEAPWQRW